MFFGIPLSTQLKQGDFFFEFELSGVKSNALVVQGRLFDTKRLENKIGMMNKDDFEKFSTGAAESLYTILKLDYHIAPNVGISSSVDVEFVNVTVFQTGYEELKSERFVYDLKNGNRPIVNFKRKNGNPRMLMKFI